MPTNVLNWAPVLPMRAFIVVSMVFLSVAWSLVLPLVWTRKL